MTDDHSTGDSARYEPEDLDGHTIEELSDYLDAGRLPFDPSIEASPGCRLALDSLTRLRSVTAELTAQDTAAEPAATTDWVQRILEGIVTDARAGRRIPIAMPAAQPEGVSADLAITEGAVRGLVRAAEAAVPGVLVGRCRLEGDVTQLGAPVRVEAEISVPYGQSILGLVNRVREEIAARLKAHTDLTVAGIDITVSDIQHAASEGEYS